MWCNYNDNMQSMLLFVNTKVGTTYVYAVDFMQKDSLEVYTRNP